jgi:hypothetical protein
MAVDDFPAPGVESLSSGVTELEAPAAPVSLAHPPMVADDSPAPGVELLSEDAVEQSGPPSQDVQAEEVA